MSTRFTPIAPRSTASVHGRFILLSALAFAVGIGAAAAAATLVLPPTPELQRAVGLAAVALGLILALYLVAAHRFLARRVARPAQTLAEAAEAVANGDFSVTLVHTSSDDEIGRLTRAVGAMIIELRRLATAIAGSARETSAMSSEITAGSEQMASSAGEIANTASDLSAQATMMAETIGELARSAGSLRGLATSLDDGARDGVARNTTLRSLALENRAGLDRSAVSLRTLGDEVNASAMAIEALGDASEEIRSFVTLVRKLARQSKLLALNAAMEAARAGEHGDGFTVVASEVRRLSTMSSDAAERTEAIVNSVLKGIANSRESAGHAVATADAVLQATAHASRSFTEIEHAVAEAELWTATIERASTETGTLVAEMTERLDSLAGGTESFAAAMQQVAASSEEQSASTEEIAAASGTLASASERLARLVDGLKIGDAAGSAFTGEHRAPLTGSRAAAGAAPSAGPAATAARIGAAPRPAIRGA